MQENFKKADQLMRWAWNSLIMIGNC